MLLEEARALGFPIESRPHLGVRLVEEEAPLTLGRLAEGLDTTIVGTVLEVHDTVASTMDLAAEAGGRGAREGLVVFAEQQTGGRGRFRRKWISTRGAGLYLSVLLKPPTVVVDKPVLTLLGAVAVAEALEKAVGLTTAIKWPNDVLVDGRKIAGILVEATGGRGCFVLGIGLNTGPVPPFPDATSVARETVGGTDRTALARALLRRLDTWYRRLLAGGGMSLEEAWRSRSADVGKRLSLECNGRSYEGEVLDVSLSEGITLRLPSGVRRTFRSEQVVIL